MKCLVTGGSGFIGQHLSRHLLRRGHSVWVTSRSNKSAATDACHWLTGDVTESEVIAGWLHEVKPDMIIHLAAQSLPGVSWESPTQTYESNINGTLNILCAIRDQKLRPKFVMVSSSSIYAPPSGEHSLIDESGRLGGGSPYAWSKLAAEQAAILFGRHFNVDVTAIRPFFIIGPQKTGDVASDFARRIVAVEQGKASLITVGSLNIIRDFLDIDDAVTGFETVMEKGQRGTAYNLSSGKGISIRKLLDTYKKLARVAIEEKTDPALVRPIDEPVKVGDPSRLRELGWSPNVSFEESLRRILEYWRTEMSRKETAA